MQLRYMESKEQRMYGLQLWDRDEDFALPRLVGVVDSLRSLNYSGKEINEKLQEINDGNPVSAPRLFVGKSRNRQVGLFIQDEFGRDRIRIYVDEQNKPRIELLDAKGNVNQLKDLD